MSLTAVLFTKHCLVLFLCLSPYFIINQVGWLYIRLPNPGLCLFLQLPGVNDSAFTASLSCFSAQKFPYRLHLPHPHLHNITARYLV